MCEKLRYGRWDQDAALKSVAGLGPLSVGGAQSQRSVLVTV